MSLCYTIPDNSCEAMVAYLRAEETEQGHLRVDGMFQVVCKAAEVSIT